MSPARVYDWRWKKSQKNRVKLLLLEKALLINIDLIRSNIGLHINTHEWAIDPHDIHIEEELGESFHSKIFLASCKNQFVAVKAPKFNRPITDGELRIVAMELSGIKNLVHPNIVSIFGACVDTDFKLCLLTQFEDRGNLEKIIYDENSNVSQQEVLNYCIQLCKGMQFLHGHTPPVAHGNLKPSNILVL
jgi:serine/threonine protein kinase